MANKILTSFTLLLSLLSLYSAYGWGGASNCTGPANELPILTAEPVLMDSVPNGKKFIMQNGSYYVYIGVFEGSPYEVGLAYGQLFAKEMEENFDQMFDWMINYVKTAVVLPDDLKWVQKMPDDVIRTALNVYLDTERKATAAFTNQDWQDEFKGMAEGANMTSDRVQNFNLVPEATRASCSIYGAWGPATSNGGLLHLRALDWDPTAPMSQFPVIGIYKFNTPGSQPFANFGWAGMVGSLAGFSPKIGIGEKLWGDKGKVKMDGEPWMYVLRDVLQYATDLNSGVEILTKANRTWAIHVALSSKADNQLEIIQYAAEELQITAVSNFTSPCPDKHPEIDGILYLDNFGIGACNPCVGDELLAQYGNLTAEYLVRNPAAMSGTGDTMLAVYDFDSQFVHIAYSGFNGSVPAYNRSQMALNMTELFNIQVNSTADFEKLLSIIQ